MPKKTPQEKRAAAARRERLRRQRAAAKRGGVDETTAREPVGAANSAPRQAQATAQPCALGAASPATRWPRGLVRVLARWWPTFGAPHARHLLARLVPPVAAGPGAAAACSPATHATALDIGGAGSEHTISVSVEAVGSGVVMARRVTVTADATVDDLKHAIAVRVRGRPVNDQVLFRGHQHLTDELRYPGQSLRAAGVHDGDVVLLGVVTDLMEAARTLTAMKVNLAEDARSWGWTPLHSAAAHGFVAAAELLLRGGADLDTRDANGCTPVRVAVDHAEAMWPPEGGHAVVLQLLLRAKADPDVPDHDGATPVHALLARVADAAVGDSATSGGPGDPNCTVVAAGGGRGGGDGGGGGDGPGSSARYELALVGRLVSAHANVNVLDAAGRTGLHAAVDLLPSPSAAAAAAAMLLGRRAGGDGGLGGGCDMDARRLDNGWTALHVAANADDGCDGGVSLRVMEMLLEAGCDPNVPNNDGLFALDVCGDDACGKLALLDEWGGQSSFARGRGGPARAGRAASGVEGTPWTYLAKPGSTERRGHSNSRRRVRRSHARTAHAAGVAWSDAARGRAGGAGGAAAAAAAAAVATVSSV